MIRNLTFTKTVGDETLPDPWQGSTWNQAITDYHRRTNIALDPDAETTIPRLQAAGYEEFTPVPIPEQPPAPVRRLTKLQFLNRFINDGGPDDELVAIYTAAKASVQVEVWLAKFNAATPEMDGTSIDLDDPRTVAGVQALEAGGLIGVGRAAEILA